MKTLRITLFVCVSSILMMSCVSLYDHYTYTETIDTKVQILNLMDLSDESYTLHESKVNALKNQIEKMLTYERGKGKNEITIKMWEVLHKENGLIGKYLSLWKDKGKLSSFFIKEAKPQVKEAFDILITFEEKKDKKSEKKIQDFINNL